MALRSKRKPRLVLLDAHAIIHRAYHALPDFTGPDGQPTGALYGIVAMLLKIVNDLDPDYLAACYDLAAPTVRHEAYEDYKGTRQKLEDALVAQIEKSRAVFKAFNVPLYERKGFEADDLLGTIAHELAAHKGLDIIIASGDMDTLQLVDDECVRVYTLKKGLNDTVLYDEKAVLERYGFKPSLIPDYKGLRGDSSDNIKGVPGIGDKTATELIQAFGTVEAIYAALKKKGADETFAKAGVKPRVVNLLREHEEDARFSKALATIRLDAPVAFSLPEKPWRETVSLPAVLAMFDIFGFRSLRERAKKALAKEDEPFVEDEAAEDARAAESVDGVKLTEAAVMLWLISSEFTNPSLEDILAFTKERNFSAAYAKLEAELQTLGRVAQVYREIEQPLIPVLRRMEARGVLIDRAALGRLEKRYQKELASIEQRIFDAAGKEFNVNSPKQLAEVLYDDLGIKPERMKRTAGGQRSTKESELEKLREGNPIVSDILEYRELKKLLGTYIENLPPLLDASDRLHTEFIQTGTSTGRLASQNPNLQNIPLHSDRGKAIRDAFVAPPGFTLLALDYSQIELRLAAILSGDEKLCEVFRNGRDVHREVAAMVFDVAPEDVDMEMRRRAKVINFGILYGMGVNALRVQLGSTTAEAHRFLDEYFHTFTTLAEYLERTKGFARKHGYTETLFGRRRQFPEMKSTLPYVRAQAERMAINAPIQGTEGDLIKLAMVQTEAMLERAGAEEDAHLVLSVHDELIYEIRHERMSELAPRLKGIMEQVISQHETHGVPITVEMKSGADWGHLERLDA